MPSSFGTLKADTLTHSTAGSLATNFVVNGSAKAWVNLSSSAMSISGSFNASSLVDDSGATGVVQVNLTNSFNNVSNMSVGCGAANGTSSTSYYICSGWTKDTSAYWVRGTWGTTGYDIAVVMGQVNGELA